MATKDWFKEGNNWFDKGDYQKALDCYESGLDTDYTLDDVSSETMLANSEKALSVNPNDARALLFKGFVYYRLKKYSEAIQCYDKAIELKEDYVYVYNNKGIALDELGKYKEAVQCFDKAIEVKPDYVYAYNNKGIALENLGKYEDAIQCFDKAIEIKPDFVYVHYNKGSALDELGKYEEAMQCFDKAIGLKPDDVNAYNNKGIVLENIGKYEEAIECFDKVIELKPDDVNAHYNKGSALENIGKYEEAIQCFDKVIELKPDDINAYNNKGIVLDELDKYEEAIQCYDKAINIDNNFAYAYHNKGYALYNLGKYEEAIQYYDKAIDLENDNAKGDAIVCKNKGIALDKLGKYEEAAKCFDTEKIEILDIVNSVNGETVKYILDSYDFFKTTTKNVKEEKEVYKEIFIYSLNILKVLRVEKEYNETSVARYIKKTRAENLLFKRQQPLQLNSVSTANDPQEGKTLFDYLFDNGKMRPRAEQYGAFYGCFMFNHDNLNQFRLYGKDKGTEEGTGVSIVLNDNFFSLKDKLPFKQAGRHASIDDEKEPLYRCIYIDPDTNQVVSIGHRDHHTFYKVNDILYKRISKEEIAKRIITIEEEIKAYKKYIDGKLKEVTKYLKEMKTTIDSHKLDYEVVCNLLLNLRYLIKHVAFKEEQECRIIKIKKYSESGNDSPKVDKDNQRLYVDYLEVKDYCVEKIYFGPKATGMDLFQHLLAFNGFKDVTCYRSTNPLNIKDQHATNGLVSAAKNLIAT